MSGPRSSESRTGDAEVLVRAWEEANDVGTGMTLPERSQASIRDVRLQDQTNLLPARLVFVIICGVNCAVFCVMLDQAILTTAMPTIGEYFGDANRSGWLATANFLTTTAVQPLSGRFSDIFGRKAALLASLCIFFFATLASSLAQSLVQLIVFRAFAGLGAGGVTSLAMIVVSDVVTLRERGKYQGIMGTTFALSASVGPILGGVFSQIGWRWCYYINLPMTALSALLVAFVLPLKPIEGRVIEKLKLIDYYGSVISIVWVGLVLLGFSWAGTEFPWASAQVLAPIIIGLALCLVFVFIEIKLATLPLIPMFIFRNVTVAASMVTTAFNGAVYYATIYYLPQYFQVVRGETPLRSGVLVLPLTLMTTLCSIASGYAVAFTGDYKWNLVIGFSMWTMGIGFASTIDPTTSLARLGGYQLLIGVGAGQTFQTSLLAIQAGVRRQDIAAATGCRNFVRMLGGTIALALCSTILDNTARSRLATSELTASLVSAVLAEPSNISSLGLSDSQMITIRSAFATGIDACFWFMIPMTGLATLVTFFLVKQLPLRREDDQARKAEARDWIKQRSEARAAYRE